ncbi:MAG: tRNA dihydrouridine synthase DusB [Candidatus Xenobium sp.]|jgi:tRNA-dihydrouridine synthase B|nr:tRNA dihydrouridine synthase DusB [Burkholderiales bacterium]
MCPLLRPLRLGSLTWATPLLLAPMAGQTDHAFRQVCREQGGLGLATSELVSARALKFPSSRSRTLELFDWRPEEGPVAVQICGAEPEEMADAAREVVQAGAAVVDVNMGCWVPKVARQGGGAGLLRDPERATEVLRAVVKAVEVPVTVKIRAGWDAGSLSAVEIARRAADCGVAGVTVHARHAMQGMSGLADWQIITRVVRAVPEVPVIGNGDVTSPAEARRMLVETGCAGVMIGRAALGSPWVFRRVEHELRTGLPLPEPDRSERATVALHHARKMLLTTRIPASRAIRKLRGQLLPYALDPSGTTDVRDALVRIETPEELMELLTPLTK